MVRSSAKRVLLWAVIYKFKHLVFHNSLSLQPYYILFLLSSAMAHDFNVWTADVTQGFLQSTDSLLRDILTAKHVPEFELEPHQCLKLIKPLYGLCDAGDLRASSMDKHHRNDLGMYPVRSEPALYVKHTDWKLIGISGSYLDDVLRASQHIFRKLCLLTHEKFDMADEEFIPSGFTGFTLKRTTVEKYCNSKELISRSLRQSTAIRHFLLFVLCE